MDGDTPDLKAIAEVARAHGAALVVDEAHALGVFGPEGAGLCAAQGIVPDALVGTLGKALGVQGAFVAGTERLREFLWNTARSLVFSTAISPLLAAAAHANLRRARADDGARARLLLLAGRVRDHLALLERATPAGNHGPILPILTGDGARALALADHLRSSGVLTRAIRPPTVPEGTARLRVTVKATFTDTDIERVCGALTKHLR